MDQIPYIGESFALLTALLWALSVILFKLAGMKIPPLALNLFKNAVALVLLLITLPLIGQRFFYEGPWIHHALIFGSGVIGIGLSDTLFFGALNRLGATRMAVVECLYSPSVIFFSYLYLGETLTLWAIFGALLIITSVILPSLGKMDHELSRRDWWVGIAMGATAMMTVGVAIVAVKPLLDVYPLIWMTTARMAGGLLSLMIFTALHPQRKRFYEAFRPQAAWKIAIPASILGSYITLITWMAGFKYTDANTAGLLNQTSIVFVVVLAMLILKERISQKKLLALLLAITGSIIVILN